MSAAAQRWTPRRIRAATPFPKPAGAIARARAYDAGDDLRQRRSPIELVLRHIAEHGDFIDRPVISAHGTMPGRWLLVPLPFHLVEILAEFEADLADIEDGGEAEPDQDGELDLGAAEEIDQREAWRVSADREGNLGAPDGIIDQTLWRGGVDDFSTEREPDHDLEAIDNEDGAARGYSAGGNENPESAYGATGLRLRVPVIHHADLSEWRKV